MAKKDVVTTIQAEAEKKETKIVSPPIDLSEFVRVSSETWRPEVDEYIIGVYDGSEQIQQEDKGGKIKVFTAHLVIDIGTGNRIAVAGGVLMDKNIERGEIKKGDTIFFRYIGVGDTREGNKLNLWDIRVKR